MKLSVIIPVYNCAPWIEACLRSVVDAVGEGVGRGVEEVEVICVDDGSTDGSSEILDEFFLHSPPAPNLYTYKIFHQQNLGVSAARNRGLEEASGEWVCFVDGDDAVVPEYFAEIFRLIRETEADIVHFNHVQVASQTEGGGARLHEGRLFDLTGPEFAAGFNAMRTLLVWNACYRRSLIGEARFASNLPRGEDSLFALQMFCRARCVYRSSAILYRYLLREGSAMNRVSRAYVESSLESFVRQDSLMRGHPRFREIAGLWRRVRITTLGGEIYRHWRRLSREERRGVQARFGLRGPALVRLMYLAMVFAVRLKRSLAR